MVEWLISFSSSIFALNRILETTRRSSYVGRFTRRITRSHSFGIKYFWSRSRFAKYYWLEYNTRHCLGAYCFACNLTRKKSPSGFGFNYVFEAHFKIAYQFNKRNYASINVRKIFLQWIHIILDDVWADVRNNETVLTPFFHKLERNLRHVSLKTPPMMPT